MNWIDKIVSQFIFNIIKCFAVENLEWEFLDDDDRPWIIISNKGQTMKKKSKGGVWIRLNNEIKLNLKYEINVSVSELQDKAAMAIGLGSSETWHGRIDYHHHNGQICDNLSAIKRVDTKLNKDSIMTIRNTVIKKTNNNEKIFKVSFTINDEVLCQLYYQDVKPMVPYLELDDVVEVDVEVISKI